ncbi:MAG: hypothetical protein KVP17_003243 [Porospora cf. gigantea B]|uniref:uncharacterized protein n=1 Tax=Porospora cf. gigantea B TaxID=2853592 RepID=UPI003571CD4E|nr:MAG: hypothetical protein KVP17_003243 [Porospora cf. gigantea B]
MKLVSLLVFKWVENSSVLLSITADLSEFNFFTRNSIREHIIFHSRLIVGRTPVGSRQAVSMEEKLGRCYAYVHPSGLAAAVLTDNEYPMRVAFNLLSAALRDFFESYGMKGLEASADQELEWPRGMELLQEYKDPDSADKLSKVQRDLDEVKEVMLKNIDDLLLRGEQMESLMQKTNDLSSASYTFYRQAKKNNQCCTAI